MGAQGGCGSPARARSRLMNGVGKQGVALGVYLCYTVEVGVGVAVAHPFFWGWEESPSRTGRGDG